MILSHMMSVRSADLVNSHERLREAFGFFLFSAFFQTASEQTIGKTLRILTLKL